MTEYDNQQELPPTLATRAIEASMILLGAGISLVGSFEALSANTVSEVCFGTLKVVIGAAAIAGANSLTEHKPTAPPIEN